jgi:hypothetical protein
MKHGLQRILYGLLILGSIVAPTANADMGMGLRAGTFGYGVDLDVGLTEKLTLRLAYNRLSFDQTIEDTDVTYDGTLNIDSFSGYLDWFPFGGGFKLSVGAVSSGPAIDVDGTPAPGTFVEIGDTTYSATQVGSLRGEIILGKSVAPYIGLGYGNVVSEKHRVTFLFDVGAIYSGTPDVTMYATCGPALAGNPAACAQLQRDVQDEIDELKTDAATAEWYPVINIGIGIRF